MASPHRVPAHKDPLTRLSYFVSTKGQVIELEWQAVKDFFLPVTKFDPHPPELAGMKVRVVGTYRILGHGDESTEIGHLVRMVMASTDIPTHGAIIQSEQMFRAHFQAWNKCYGRPSDSYAPIFIAFAATKGDATLKTSQRGVPTASIVEFGKYIPDLVPKLTQDSPYSDAPRDDNFDEDRAAIGRLLASDDTFQGFSSPAHDSLSDLVAGESSHQGERRAHPAGQYLPFHGFAPGTHTSLADLLAEDSTLQDVSNFDSGPVPTIAGPSTAPAPSAATRTPRTKRTITATKMFSMLCGWIADASYKEICAEHCPDFDLDAHNWADCKNCMSYKHRFYYYQREKKMGKTADGKRWVDDEFLADWEAKKDMEEEKEKEGKGKGVKMEDDEEEDFNVMGGMAATYDG